MSRYVCVKDCYYNNKRYSEGDTLEEGVEPNSFFKEAPGGYSSFAKSIPGTESLSVDEAAKMIGDAEQNAAKNLETFKELVGEHLAKFDEQIKALEDRLEEIEAKLNSFVETTGAQAPQGNEATNPESQKNDTTEPAAKNSAKK